MSAKTIVFSRKGQPGNLLDPANWVHGVVPGINDTALITMNAGAPVSGTFAVNNMMLLGSETITFAGTLDTAGVGACQGLMVCDGAEAIFAPGATLNDGNVLIVGNDAAGALLARGTATTHATLNSIVANLGKQDAGIGTVTIDDAIWTNSGRVAIGDDGSGTLNVIDNGLVKFGGDADMAVNAGSKGEITISGGGSILVAGALRVGGAASGVASVIVAAHGSLSVGATLVVGDGSDVAVTGGTIGAKDLRTLAGGVLAGYGTLTAQTIQDDDTILATGGNLRINGDMTGTGSAQIAANSTATLTGDSLRLAGIAFLGTGATLALAHGSNVTATISGFAIGDMIAMANVDAVSFNAATGWLTISEHNAQVESVHFAGQFSGDVFGIHQTMSSAMITLAHQ